MWLKNLQLLRLTGFEYDLESLIDKMEADRLTPLSAMELTRSGWVPPRDGGELVEKIGDVYVLALGTESKIMPASAITYVLDARVKALEEQQGFAPGKKARKELKERVADELLPRALTVAKRVQILLDPKGGWIMIDSASTAAHDAALRFIIKHLALPIDGLFTKHRPSTLMTSWVEENEGPYDFTLDDEVMLASSNKGVLRLKNVNMKVAQGHALAGDKVTQLAMTFAAKVSFLLTDNLTIKRIKPLDIIKEPVGQIGDAADRYTAEMMLCIDTIKQLIEALVIDELVVVERGHGEAQGELKMAA